MGKKDFGEYEPSEDEEYMSELQLKYFSEKLITLRSQLIKNSESKKNELKDVSLRTPDLFDSATNQEEIVLEIKEIDRQTRQVSLIDRALSRIRAGEYGYCEMTGEEIGIKRLQAQPLATLCIEVQEMLERKSGPQSGYQVVM